MTRLTKPVTRFVALKRGEVAVRLSPAGIIEFRFKRARRWYPVDLNIILARAVMAEVASRRRRRSR